ncbi:uncharacterized protein N7496_001734 [Penicillium cataractarum]|uniref:Uncharacterized protein n=1 Tax=Penicillium cataractarum TaxID=2100454 RepID=A0A9X0B783_9EURO|nr:uncharacterized protein N7496_001734 [Penicillium cataractarum]KAJ5390666.1 hypothetical protein N7496_001734 [Penicillium cataractarum]
MWSKGPFKSRRPIGNPTFADKTSLSADPARYANAKDLPALPYDSTISVKGAQVDQATAPMPPARNSLENEQYPDVSPAVSPELGPRVRDSGSSFCVSPIEESETDRGFRHDRTGSWGYGVAAPAPSRAVNTEPLLSEPSQSAPKTIKFTPNSDEQPTRWDAYSGEPTKSNAGRAGQVEPRNTNFHKVSGSHTTNFLHWGREQLQPKKKFAQARGRISSFSKNENNRAPETRDRSSSRVLPLAEHSVNKDAISQPKNPNLGFVPTVVTTITGGNPKPLPERPATEHAYKAPRREISNNNLDPAIDDMLRSAQPPSRFGVPNTAGAMDTGSVTASPDDSPRTSLNLGTKSTEDLPGSIMSRRRPVPISMPTSKKPVRKPIPSVAVQEPTLATQSDDAPKDTLGRIEAFEARRDELAKRRFNLETVIHELTRVIQPGSIAYDLAAKAEVKRSVQSIENEIAEIKREEHELGLKVTRAWRRLDERENHGDGSNLWVKRVTS